MNKNTKNMSKMIICILVLGLLLVSACQISADDSKGDNAKKDSETKKEVSFELSYNQNVNIETKTFKDEDEYLEFMKLSQSSGNYYGGSLFRGGEDMVMALAESEVANSAPMVKTANDGGTGLDYSETNNQVQGVDEGDILKTDGKYIYTITKNTLFIVEAYPGKDAKVVSTIEFEEKPSGLFVNGDTLTVFGTTYNVEDLNEAGVRVRNGMTFFEIYDISDRENPKLEKEFKYEGRYYNSRMIQDTVYLITEVYPSYRMEPITPIILEDGEMSTIKPRDIYYFNIPYHNPHFVGIHSINIKNKENEESKMIAVEGSPNMYMSENNIFLTYTERINEWELQREVIRKLIEPKLPDHYVNLIEKIEDVDLDVLSPYEKQNKIMNIIYEYENGLTNDERDDLENESEKLLKEILDKMEYFEYTVINKIAVDGGDITVESNGKAPGSVINQFSMDEYEDVFRIGTTVNTRWSRFGSERTQSSNNVYTLDEDLEIIGKLEGLAKGESIYSTRFMGDRLYLVTFRQVDPFFVIDLSNPKKPESLGELKIPGFSRYLHPYDENTIIGIGRDASETGRQEGLKISLFDVSNVKKPKEVAKYVADSKYSGTSAEYEHKAFLFSKEKNLLVIPVYSYEGSRWMNGAWVDGGESYNGAFVFNIDKNDIELRGLIDHSKAAQNRYSPAVERSLYIEDLLYTKSPYLLRINELEDLSSVKNVELDLKNSGNIPIY